jgi:hypothetical protein
LNWCNTISPDDGNNGPSGQGARGRINEVRYFIYLHACRPTLDGVRDDAFEKGGGYIMTDAVVKTYFILMPLLYAQSAWSVKGDVVRIRKCASM